MPVATVGETATHEVAITEETIEAFAALSGDENPIHLDDEYAAERIPCATRPSNIVYLSQEMSFEKPVYPGETVEASVSVIDDLGGDRVVVETTATVPERDERVLSGEATVLSLPHESA